ncbi:hypothetical protein GCM10009753_24970 [Streptantibioticus ferralitis]
MQITGVALGDFYEITAHISQVSYGGNVMVSSDAHVISRNRIAARLRVADSRGAGARTAASGRHGPYACWHAYRDVLSELFREHPRAIVSTALERYRGADGFESAYPATAYRNVGSQLYPAYMPDLCVTAGCGEERAGATPVIIPAPRQHEPEDILVRIRQALQEAERSRPETYFTGPDSLLGVPDLAYSDR